MTMIGVGRRQLDIANRGLAAVSRAESVEEQQRLAIEAQKTAAQNSTLGLGAGIGAQVGLKNLAATKATTGSKLATQTVTGAEKSIGISKAAMAGGEVGGAVNSVGTAVQGLQGGVEGIQIAKAAGTGAEVGGAINNVGTALQGIEGGVAITEGALAGAEVGGAISNVAAGVEAVGTAGATTTTTAAAGTGAAAGAGGTAATLGAIAAPVAIGLGVAFLLNKLFD